MSDAATSAAIATMNGHAAPKQLLTQTYTKRYRPPISAVAASWGSTLTPGVMFTLEMVRDMLQDSQVSSCLNFLKSPLFMAEREIAATDKRTQAYVEKAYQRFWHFALQHANRRFEYGHSPGEAIYRDKDGMLEFRGMRPIWPKDATPWTNGETLDFVEVRNVKEGGEDGAPLRLMGPREDRPAKGLWFVHKPTYSQFWGRSVLLPVWFPWRLKRMPDGMWEIVFKFAYRHSLGHTIGRHPDSMVEGPNGQDIWAQDLMRFMLQNLKAGSDITLPGTKDENGNFLWEIERDSVVQGDAQGLLNILEALDKEIQRGMGITDEVINFEGEGTNAKAKVAVLSFYVSLTEDYYQLSESFDDQVVRPSVKMMAKRGKLPSDAAYEVKPKPLMPPDQQQQEGAGGARPIAPGGVPAVPKPLPFGKTDAGGAGGVPQTPTGMPSGAMFSFAQEEDLEGWAEIATKKATHVRIVGPTKSGKSVLAQALAAQMPGKLFIIDPVWVPGNWGGLPAATVSADGDYTQIREAINGLLAEMRRRSAKLQEGQRDFERLTIIFDEVPDTVSELPKEAGLLIRRLSQRGRHANMHLIGIGQSSRVESWGIGGYGDVTENFCSIYLGSKAYEKIDGLRGEERPGVLEYAGKLYPIDLAEVLDRSKRAIPKSRLFDLPRTVAMSGDWDESKHPRSDDGRFAPLKDPSPAHRASHYLRVHRESENLPGLRLSFDRPDNEKFHLPKRVEVERKVVGLLRNFHGAASAYYYGKMGETGFKVADGNDGSVVVASDDAGAVYLQDAMMGGGKRRRIKIEGASDEEIAKALRKLTGLRIKPGTVAMSADSDAGGRWVTIGGKKGADGERHGGSRAYIKDGRIVKGHGSLKGKKISALSDKEPEGKPKAEKPKDDDTPTWQSRVAARIAHATRALQEHGIEPGDLHQLAAELIEHDKAFKGEHTTILKEARRLYKDLGYGNLGAGNIHQHIAKGGDADAIKGLDDVGERMQERYPDYFLGYDPQEKLYQLLSDGNPEHMSEDEAYEQAVELLWQNGGKRHKVSDAPLPFSQEVSRGQPGNAGQFGPGGFGKQVASAAMEKLKANFGPEALTKKLQATVQAVKNAPANFAWGVAHPVEALQKGKQVATERWQKLEARYGRPTALAMVGAYLGMYTTWAVNPLLGAMVAPSPLLMTTALGEAILAVRKTAGAARAATALRPGAVQMGHEDGGAAAEVIEMMNAIAAATGEQAPQADPQQLAAALAHVTQAAA